MSAIRAESEAAMIGIEPGEAGSEQAERAEGRRLPWSVPKLTVRAIDDVTHGTLANTRTDGGNYYS